jgi:general stress protein YciG
MRPKKAPVTLEEHNRRIAPKGGKARAASLTDAERQEIARKGGTVGGKARAAKLTKEQRSAIARKAAAARWAKK